LSFSNPPFNKPASNRELSELLERKPVKAVTDVVVDIPSIAVAEEVHRREAKGMSVEFQVADTDKISVAKTLLYQRFPRLRRLLRGE